jgi:hypothetical protein
MKMILSGAAGLLLSGTAMAGVPASKGMADGPAATPVAVKDADGLGSSIIGNAITIDWPAKAADGDKAGDSAKLIAANAWTAEIPAAETPSTSVMSDKALAEDMAGMGGPDEAEAVATAAATPATTYRACSPGPGDDNCIQLYEPGVSEAYAAWQADRGQQLAMGGPEEPAESAAADESLTTDATDAELAAYEPLPEDAVMPASDEAIDKDTLDMAAL